jgi:peptide/nickel transport system substrate-binding protein
VAPAAAGAATAQPVAAAGTPVRGGHLRNGTNGEAANIHPLLRVDSDRDYMTDWMFDRIVDLNPKTLEPVPHLATSWDVSTDGKTFIFKFKDGVKWHDGQAFTASDVEYSLKRIQAEDYTGPFKPQFKDVQSVQTVDRLTLRINLSQPNASFLAASMRELKPVPEHLVQDQDLRTGAYATQLIGAGPYKFAEWKKGSSFSFAVNENYWGGRPNIDQITHNVVTDMNSLVASASDRRSLKRLICKPSPATS